MLAASKACPYSTISNTPKTSVSIANGVTKINKPRMFGENGYLLVFEHSLKFFEIEYLINLVKSKKIEDDVEIAYYSLFHLLKSINLEYDLHDANYNGKITNLRMLRKILTEYVSLNRDITTTNKITKLKKINTELNNIFRVIEF